MGDSEGVLLFFFFVILVLIFLFGNLTFKIISGLIILLGVAGLIWYFYEEVKEEERVKKASIDKELYILHWKEKPYSGYLGEEILKLRYDSILLLREFENSDKVFTDYSFVVSPMAKAYEGFLKKILVDVGAIKKTELKDHPGLSVNKFFHPIDGSMIKYVSDKARERAIPAVIYTVYQECRNEIMHFDLYQHESKKVVKDINEADFFVRRIEDAIEKAYYTFIEPLKKRKIKKKH